MSCHPNEHLISVDSFSTCSEINYELENKTFMDNEYQQVV
jgi:hypothetical protein